MTMKSEVKYPTRLFKNWQKAKEMTRQKYLDVATAKEQGKILVFGCAGTPYYWLAGFGDYVYWGGEPYGATVGSDRDFSAQCLRAAEGKGYGHDFCTYYLNCIGSMLLDKYYFTGGPFPKPDFIWSERFCPYGHPKSTQVMAEYLNIPHYIIDDELHHLRSGKLEQRENYVIGQLLDSIEWMEKILGKPYDLEKAIAGMMNSFEAELLWAEIILLNRTIPAPIGIRSLMGFMPAHMLYKGEPEAVAFLKELRDEMKERIADGIAAVPNERVRLVLSTPPPWGALSVISDLEKKGVVFLTNFAYAGGTWAKMEFHEDGSVTKARMPQELGWAPIKTREDLARTWFRWTKIQHKFPFGPDYIDDIDNALPIAVQFVKYLRADGVVMVSQLACLPQNLGTRDYKVAFEKANIPTTLVEYNMADPRDVDSAGLLSRLEAFVEIAAESKK
jgi:benzoyl-CoA reductase subunit B